MISIKDEIEQFKRECKSYSYYQKKINECNDKLLELNVKLEGVASPSIKVVILENTRNPYHNNKVELMMLEEEVVKERNEYAKKINKVDIILNKIEDKVVLELIYNLYIHKLKHDKVSQGAHYSRQHMYRLIDKELKKIIK